MSERGWKKFESRVAAVFGMRRRGAATSRDRSGQDDAVPLDGNSDSAYSLEMTVQSRPSWGGLLAKCRQAEANAPRGRTPLVVAKRARDRDRNALVVMRLEVFREHFDCRATLDEGG